MAAISLSKVEKTTPALVSLYKSAELYDRPAGEFPQWPATARERGIVG
ncbi:hypothetical protein [Streptomyces sp. NPDC005538]